MSMKTKDDCRNPRTKAEMAAVAVVLTRRLWRRRNDGDANTADAAPALRISTKEARMSLRTKERRGEVARVARMLVKPAQSSCQNDLLPRWKGYA